MNLSFGVNEGGDGGFDFPAVHLVAGTPHAATCVHIGKPRVRVGGQFGAKLRVSIGFWPDACDNPAEIVYMSIPLKTKANVALVDPSGKALEFDDEKIPGILSPDVSPKSTAYQVAAALNGIVRQTVNDEIIERVELNRIVGARCFIVCRDWEREDKDASGAVTKTLVSAVDNVMPDPANSLGPARDWSPPWEDSENDSAGAKSGTAKVGSEAAAIINDQLAAIRDHLKANMSEDDALKFGTQVRLKKSQLAGNYGVPDSKVAELPYGIGIELLCYLREAAPDVGATVNDLSGDESQFVKDVLLREGIASGDGAEDDL